MMSDPLVFVCDDVEHGAGVQSGPAGRVGRVSGSAS